MIMTNGKGTMRDTVAKLLYSRLFISSLLLSLAAFSILMHTFIVGNKKKYRMYYIQRCLQILSSTSFVSKCKIQQRDRTKEKENCRKGTNERKQTQNRNIRIEDITLSRYFL